MRTSDLEIAILLFDGVCNTCNAVVDFILKVDRNKSFRFASLQSSLGQSILKDHGLKSDSMDTVVLIYREKHYLYSAAVFQILTILGWPWKGLGVFSILPRPLTDYLYKLYANRRYQLFGKRSTCRLPTPEEKSRFL